MSGKVALVTGGSSGIGLASAKSLSDSGVKVYELSRRDHETAGIEHIKGDVTDEVSLQNAVDVIVQKEGGIDILVCCAGFGISGAVEFTELCDAKRQLDVNFYGTVNAVHAVLPVMRKQGRGRIVCVSSVAGAIPIPFQTYYSVSKAAINAFVSALRNEVRPYGITVTAVLPGDIRTGFTDTREKNHAGDADYEGRISRSVAGMEKDERNGMSPEKAGKYISRMALRKNVPVSSAIGFQYKLFVFLIRILPERLVSRIVYWLYAK